MCADNVEKYWTYQGSFCAPPCYETVTWIVFETPSYITSRVVNKLVSCQTHWRSPAGVAPGGRAPASPHSAAPAPQHTIHSQQERSWFLFFSRNLVLDLDVKWYNSKPFKPFEFKNWALLANNRASVPFLQTHSEVYILIIMYELCRTRRLKVGFHYP